MSSKFAFPVVWRPTPEYVDASNLAAFMTAKDIKDFDALRHRADMDPSWFWDAIVQHFHIRLFTPYKTVLDISAGPAQARWFVGATTNITHNCIDAHRGGHRMNDTAILWEGEDGELQPWTYAKLDAEICRLAEGLRGLGIQPGDVVALFMPMMPASAAALFAVAKIGAIALPLFSGFGARAVAERLRDSGARAIITVDGTHRRGRILRLKEVVDMAARSAPELRHVVIYDALGLNVQWRGPQDHWWQDFLAVDPRGSPTEAVPADHPFMLMYTSGTTGRAKATVHTHAGFLAKTIADFSLCLDLKTEDRMLWMTDLGWLGGPGQYVASTFLGSTLVIGEGSPDFPDRGRLWRLVQDHAVTYLGIRPSIVRLLMKYGATPISRCDLSSLRVAMSTGEAWNRYAWTWFFDNVCGGRIPLLDVSGGTEIGGGILGSTPLHEIRPCSFATALPGMGADIVDETGTRLPPGEVGDLILRIPSVGMTRGLWNENTRYLETYWGRFHDLWFHGDRAARDVNGYWTLLGRSDETIIANGRRLGPGEVESVLMDSGQVAEAAAVGVGDPIQGQAIVCACVPRAGLLDDADDIDEQQLAEELREVVSEALGAAFKPRKIVFVSHLPKTLKWTIMRRAVRAAFEGRNLEDHPHLINPEAVDEIRSKVAQSSANP